MNKHVLNLCFKGNRSYIQGPDIVAKTSEFIMNNLHLTDISKVDVTVHKMVKNNLNLEIHKNENIDRAEDTAAVFSFTHGEDRYRLMLSENNEKINCRHAFAEDEITSKCNINIEGKSITIETGTNYSYIEIITSMNKTLMKSLYPEIQGKWLFSRLQQNKYHENPEYKKLTVELKHNFKFMLTKSLVTIDRKEAGYIYFSLAK